MLDWINAVASKETFVRTRTPGHASPHEFTIQLSSYNVLHHTHLTSKGDVGGCPAVSGHNVNRNGIWAFRSALLMYLVRHGVDVLMNDLDARWVHDPVTQMQQRFPAADVVASRGSW